MANRPILPVEQETKVIETHSVEEEIAVSSFVILTGMVGHRLWDSSYSNIAVSNGLDFTNSTPAGTIVKGRKDIFQEHQDLTRLSS